MSVTREIEKLHLEKGDILVVKDFETLDNLRSVCINIDFYIPIIYAPMGIKKVDREILENLLGAWNNDSDKNTK